MSSGALTPTAAVEHIYHDALHHLDEPAVLALTKNVAGGLLVGLSGFAALTIAGGCPGITAANPGITHFMDGALFSVGLIMVYFTGAELFTGYPMWLAIASLQRKRKAKQYVSSVVTSLVGNWLGAFGSAVVFSYLSGTLSEDPYRAYVVDKIESSIVESEWHAVFLKSVVCGYLVTLSMLLGTQNMDGISKALGLWLPFTLATATQCPHTVEFMHAAPLAMMLGADLSVGGFLYKCMLPVILGNTVGGALFTGAYHWWVFLHCRNEEQKPVETFGETVSEYRDEDTG